MTLQVAILAAGASRRFDGIKQLAEFRGQCLLQHAITLAERIQPQPWVMLGAFADDIRQGIDLAAAEEIYVPDWREGMSASLRCCVHIAQKRGVSGLLVLLGDQPLLEYHDVRRLLDAARLNPGNIAASRYPGGRTGVPAYFPKQYFDALLALKGDQGARKLLQKGDVVTVGIGSRGDDIDTPADLVRLSAQKP